MFDLPQIVLPEVVYNGLITGLFTALAFHVVGIVQELRSSRQGQR